MAYTGLNALLAAAGIALLACGAYILDARRRMGGRH